VSRFSQAISEGDGISVVPTLAGDVAALAAEAEAAGAEAISVASAADARAARAAAGLSVIVREPVRRLEELRVLAEAGADAFVLVYERLEGEGDLLEELHAAGLELSLDCALDVHDDEDLEAALERVDPDIVLISRRANGSDEEELERALDLLPDVPAGKLVVAESEVLTREQVLALERAGVDALIVRNLGSGRDFARTVEDLAGGPQPPR
jgi:indole-3-glycerol phosphate synthase